MKTKTLYVEITNQCNLNCITCYNRSGLNKVRKEISNNQLKNIIKLFLPLGLKRVLISGGEPTLHTEFNNILNLIDTYSQISFGIVTNGTNHNKKLIDYFNTHTNLTLQISLDGSNEEINSKTRGVGNFRRVTEFAEKIHTPNKKPLLKMVISQSNFNDIENFHNLALSVGFIPEFAFIYKSGNGVDDWDSKSLTPPQKRNALTLIDSLNIKNNTKAYLPLCTSKCPYVDDFDSLSLCIKVDGSIQPCQGLYDDEYSLGNVFDFNIDSFTTRLRDIMNLARNRLKIDCGCTRCIVKDICHKGCMASAVNQYTDPLANDGECEFRKLQFVGYNLKGVVPNKDG